MRRAKMDMFGLRHQHQRSVERMAAIGVFRWFKRLMPVDPWRALNDWVIIPIGGTSQTADFVAARQDKPELPLLSSELRNYFAREVSASKSFVATRSS